MITKTDLPVLCKLLDIYETRGYKLRVGLNPHHFSNYRDAPFAALYKTNNIVLTRGGGISLQEIYFLECLSKVYKPKTIFIIGNAFGWSTIALSLIFEKSRVVAIDNVTEGAGAIEEFHLTNLIAAEEQLDCSAVIGASPHDVKPIMEGTLNGSADLVFIDGLHTNAQQMLDYSATKDFVTDNGVVLFHDVLNWGMVDSFRQIASDWNGVSQILARTPSGMGDCYRTSLRSSVGRVVEAFSDEVSGLRLSAN